VVIRSGAANLRRGAERARGKLELDGRKLIFRPDPGNGQRREASIEIVDIKRINRTWTKLLGLIPLVPNGMDVVMRNGETFAFTVNGRKAWIEEISIAQADTPKG
jgi:hypothetical protein